VHPELKLVRLPWRERQVGLWALRYVIATTRVHSLSVDTLATLIAVRQLSVACEPSLKGV
jgi:hypothetical protein